MADLSQNEKKNIVLGITGSIAAYKSAFLARHLVSRGYSVKVVMTEGAQKFITPMTMQGVSGHPVATTFWNEEVGSGIGHIDLASWADALVVAPASADFIAKLAHGIADDPLLAVALATRSPLLVCPAMNVNMLQHPQTQENIDLLRKRGVSFVDAEEGALACGWNGAGRLADPEEIFHHVRRVLSKQDFTGKRVLISTGPTREMLDPVRYISNRSSGKMGVALAREAFRRGAEVTLVHGPVPVRVPQPITTVGVTSAQEMYDAIVGLVYHGDHGPAFDLVIMAAAVADFAPDKISEQKIKKTDAAASISLKRNPDILLELGRRRTTTAKPMLVGFAVETGELEDLIAEARRKLESKNADLIVGNFAAEAFDLDTNRVWLVDREGRQDELATTFKSRVANKVLDATVRLGF